MSVETNGQVPNLVPPLAQESSCSALAVPEPEASNSGDEMHEHHHHQHHLPMVNSLAPDKQSLPTGYKPTSSAINGHHDHMVVAAPEMLNANPHDVHPSEVAVAVVTRPSGGVAGLFEDEGSKRVMEKDGEERVVMSSKYGRFLKYDCEIGRGSFKTVYKGVDTETGVPVAWCELQENKYNKAEQVRFKEEVSILKTLQHPNILRLYDYWEYSRQLDKKKILVLITELMTSGTLKGYMRRLKSIKPRLIRSWGRQILKGLHFLHTRTPPIIHRDLKCDNIFINGTTGLVKIGDLGLATLKRSDVSTVIGTPEFMAPEMYEESYDESVDVYAFGMCLLEMYTQEYPYMECSNPAQIYKKVTQGIRPVAMSKVKDPILKEIIDKCVIPEKSKRFVVKQLLDHEFFSEGEMKVDLVNVKDGTQLFFKMEGPQRVNKNGQDIVQFTYNMDEDKPDSVVFEMVNSGILRPEDKGHVSRSIREHVESVLMKHKAHQQGGKDSVGKENIPTSSLIKEHSVSEEKEKERGKEAQQRQNLANVTIPAATTTATPVPPSSETQSTEEQALTTPPVAVPAISAANLPSKVQRQTSTNESSRDQPEGHLPPPPMSDEATESHSSSAVVTKTTAESLVSSAPPLHPVATEVPVSEDTESQFKLGLVRPAAAITKEANIDTGLRDNKLFKVEVEPPAVEDGLAAARTLESGGSSASSILSALVAGDSQGDLGHEHPQGNDGARKKSGRPKEPKSKTLRLKHTYLSKDHVLGCSLNTSVGQVVNFKFSIEYDKPKEIFHNFVKAKHLTPSEEEEFICQVTRIIEMVRRGEIVPTNVKLTNTEGKSLDVKPTEGKPLATETQKLPAGGQLPGTIEGVTAAPSSKVDPHEPRQQQALVVVPKQQPSPDLAGLRIHSGEKEAVPLVVMTASDDNSPGSRKKLSPGEEKSALVGSHVEDQSLAVSQTEERHSTLTTIAQPLPETVMATSPVHALNVDESIASQHQSADLLHKATAISSSSSSSAFHHNQPAATTATANTIQPKTMDVLTAATDAPVMATTGMSMVSTATAASYPLTTQFNMPTSSSNAPEASKKFDIEDVVDSPVGSIHAGSLSEESSSEATQMDDNRSVNGGDWRVEEGHGGLESVSSTSVGHQGLISDVPAVQHQMNVTDHPESFFAHQVPPPGTVPPGSFPAAHTVGLPPTATAAGSYPLPVGTHHASIRGSYPVPYSVPVAPYKTASDPHHQPGPAATPTVEFYQLMQGFLRFLTYMNQMMEDPAIQQLLRYSTPSSTVPDAGSKSSPQDQKGPPFSSSEHVSSDAWSDRDLDSQPDYESDPEYKKLIERYQEEAFKQAKAKALKHFRSGRTHRMAAASSVASTGPVQQPVSTGVTPVAPESMHGDLVEHGETAAALNHVHVRGLHPRDHAPHHPMVAGHSASYAQYPPFYYVMPPPPQHVLSAGHIYQQQQQPLPVAMQGTLHGGGRHDASLEMDHIVSHGR